MKYEKKWGYMLATTKLPGIYRNQKGGFVVRARVIDPTGAKKEILKSLDLDSETEALTWLANEKARVQTGTAKPQSMLFSVFAADLFEAKLKEEGGEGRRRLRKIRSQAGEDKWRHTLTHLVGGTTVNGSYVRGFGDFPITEIRAAHVDQWLDGLDAFRASGDYAPTTLNSWISILRVISKAAAKKFEIADFMQGIQNFDLTDHVTYADEAPNALKPADVPRFLEVLKERWPQHFAMCLLGFVTGLRPSSLRPLRRTGPSADAILDRRASTRSSVADARGQGDADHQARDSIPNSSASGGP